jgi:type II secretory pathway component PulM
MSDPTNIFNEQNPGNNLPNEDAGNVNANPDAELATLLLNIKNERGEPKYKTTKEALIALQHSQTFIPDLKTQIKDKDAELERLRAERSRIETLEETIRGLADRGNNTDTPSAQFTKEQIAEIVNKSLDSTLSQREQASLQKANVQSVVSTLRSTFGVDAEKRYNEAAVDLGMSVAELNALAAKNPKVVLKSLGIDPMNGQAFHKPNVSGINTLGYQPKADSFVGRNKNTTQVGATTQDLMQETRNANKMVEELHAQGINVSDLSDPKKYFKLFG